MSRRAHHNRIDYIELPAADLAATKGFYAQVFGWTFTDYGPDYAAFNDGRLDGGFDASDAPSGRGGPLVVFYVSDLEACRAEVLAAGGEIVKDIFSFPGGRRFHFTDPTGTELAAWSE